MEEFEKQTEEYDNTYEEKTQENPPKNEGLEFEEIITITKIS